MNPTHADNTFEPRDFAATGPRRRKPRLRIDKEAPDQLAAMYALSQSIDVDERLGELVKVYVSQLNRCAFCIDMHWRDARKLGESETRLYSLPAWRESDLYEPAERAALALAERLTRLAGGGEDRQVWDDATAFFEPVTLAHLLFLIATVNTWNRLMIGAGVLPAP